MSKLTTLLARAANCVAASVCVVCAAATLVAAQTPTAARPDAPPVAAAASPTPSPTNASNTTDNPDLSITANVTARELRFEVVPTPKVEFPGRPHRDTVWEAERTNLPPQVQPGVTYRDLGIRLKITSVFADIERIVAEALGEIPASDDAAPPANSNPNAQPPVANAPLTTDAAQPDKTTQANEATSSGDAPASISSTQTSPASSSQARRAGGSNSRPSGVAQPRRGRH
ncbi:MAG: hypothetical protein QOG00_1269 [Pyrinomonadaceae bacterium]|nr:hypothetical protein [Pyrinomonadaceae bacterium]